MPRTRLALGVAAASALLLTGCATGSAEPAADDTAESGGSVFPVTVEHAYGETTINEKPERVATIAWGNQDVALALGIVPVGMDAQVWAWSGASEPDVYEWTSDKLDELGADLPVLFDTTDGVDFEAIADTAPQVVLAAQSGLSEEDYATLSDIAPVVSFPDIPWFTPWRDQITLNATGLGLEAEGEALVADIEQQIADATADAAFEGKTAAFFYMSPADLSTVSLYTNGDSRTAFLNDLGFDLPQVAIDAAAEGSFYLDYSAENADQLEGVDVIVTYGDETLLPALQADPLWSTLPAVQNGAVVAVGEGDAYSAAVSPTALSIPWVLDQYVTDLTDAAAKVQ
ncbi:iron complex transport system substrate-binding protein [Microbacterium terrae]|uniref:Ferrienterobactin-binding periplasmic protein n=1 Tax=Microbacterium terrae TaxID=69369 RepID=A0A0M2H366_9MICO|nr:iron-siderophore ABC transporter substrate-binding protein [Microbacterium terrae]KJL38086.1 Ferrienterobactin-binding periplasmic protein precursor [Microbacterium terrae]MBP1077499.1 iron complex transport system substrate-binding protein [Microbacterium terrae]GLJ99104.1 periplasmic binding protein [Microbacterium terrae]